MKYTKKYLKEAHSHSSYNEEILSSDFCACFYCLEKFIPELIEEVNDINGIEDPYYVACPYCGFDSVIGSNSGFPIDEPGFMTAMKEYFF
jgi:hypothetical protein